MTKQGKDIENLKKKVQAVETLKQSLEKDKERLKQEFVKKNKVKWNWVFATNSSFLIPISLQPYGVNLWYFKLRLFD